jgi:anti-sigma factor RsiW
VTHLGQRLSALIDGELSGSERERVLLHITRCGACQDEVAALRTLKKRMNALGEAAAGAGLTGRLMGLRDSVLGSAPMTEQAWPQPSTWDVPSQPARPEQGAGQTWDVPSQPARPEQRAGRYFLAGSLVIFLAGLGTAAFIAGGEPQAQAPSLPVTPSVDVLVVPHESLNGDARRLHPELAKPTPASLISPRP